MLTIHCHTNQQIIKLGMRLVISLELFIKTKSFGSQIQKSNNVIGIKLLYCNLHFIYTQNFLVGEETTQNSSKDCPKLFKHQKLTRVSDAYTGYSSKLALFFHQYILLP